MKEMQRRADVANSVLFSRKRTGWRDACDEGRPTRPALSGLIISVSYGRSGREREDQLSQPNFEDSHAVFTAARDGRRRAHA